MLTTDKEIKQQAELHDLEERYGPALGQYIYDQLDQDNIANANRDLQERENYKKAA